MKEAKLLKMYMKQLHRSLRSKEITKKEYDIQFQKELANAIITSGITRTQFLKHYLGLGL